MPSDANQHGEILVVSDAPESGLPLREALETWGHRVREVRDGEACLREVAAKLPDLIVCDLHMSGLNGIDVCRRVRESGGSSHIPVVLVTDDTDLEARLDGIRAGADDLLIRPIDMAELMARIAALLRMKGLHDEVRRQRRIIDSLLTISTLCQGYTDASTRLFADFGRRTAELLRAKEVAVILGRRGGVPQVLSCHPVKNHPSVSQKISSSLVMGVLLHEPGPLIVSEDNEAQREDLGLEEGFIGVPILAHEGQVVGAVVAFGTPPDLPPECVQILMTLAQRVGAEIQLRDHSERLEDLVSERTRDLESAKSALERSQEETTFRLALAAECHDTETAGHLQRIGRLCELLGQVIGLDSETVALLHHASVMHDIGKIGIPDLILRKPGKLTVEEYETMKTHTLLGAQIFRDSNSQLLQMSERIALGHHEHWDGSGYPHGRRGDQIPLEARIVAVADVFDALVSKRPYKHAWDMDEALNHLTSLAGTHLDPNLVEAFLQVRETVTQIATSVRDDGADTGEISHRRISPAA